MDKSAVVRFRCSPQEKAKLEERAKGAESLSDWIRRQVGLDGGGGAGNAGPKIVTAPVKTETLDATAELGTRAALVDGVVDRRLDRTPESAYDRLLREQGKR
jgi:hypothetical protein